MSYCVRVEPGAKVELAKIDPAANGGLTKAKGGKRAAELYLRLGELQQELYAAGTDSLLIVLQGMDTSGKDGTIRHVLSGVNPQGCQVTSLRPRPARSWRTTSCGGCTARSRSRA